MFFQDKLARIYSWIYKKIKGAQALTAILLGQKMKNKLLLSVQDSYVTFGGKPLFEALSFNIHEGDKICLVGKNGAGKTTLMHIIDGTREIDSGKRWQETGIKVGYLKQDNEFDFKLTVYEYILSGLPIELQNSDSKYLVDIALAPLDLAPQEKMGNLSGGQLRRAALGKQLVNNPDILLLDEPTNHLDIRGIEWLEDYINSYRGTILCVSHDRTFLSNISNKVFWLDRGKIRVCSKGFAYFDEWSTNLIEQEKRELRNRERAVAIEEEWANRGVKARRKRNIRRVEEMKKARDQLRSDKSIFNKTMRKIELEPVEPNMAAHIIAEFHKVSKYYARAIDNTLENNKINNNPKIIMEKFNLRIMRGDRLGIVGNNGSGKTSFLKLLLGNLPPDSGKVVLAKNLEISYFDQKREDLKPNKSLWENLCPNGDYLDVMGKKRHVCGYLKDFLFDPQDAHDLAGTLSGGQKNRLMLAKVLANPGNLLILDEPTNDLDMDTLDMLLELLVNYKGTLIIVSHDRDFLDQTVTKTIVFDGDGEVNGYIGGYSDYLEAIGKKSRSSMDDVNNKQKVKKSGNLKTNLKASNKDANNISSNANNATKKLSFKLQYDWENLPQEITKLEARIKEINLQLLDSGLYMNNPDEFNKLTKELFAKQKEIADKETYWLEIDEMR